MAGVLSTERGLWLGFVDRPIDLFGINRRLQIRLKEDF